MNRRNSERWPPSYRLIAWALVAIIAITCLQILNSNGMTQ